VQIYNLSEYDQHVSMHSIASGKILEVITGEYLHIYENMTVPPHAAWWLSL
jgi:hypothetical protein